MHPVFPPPPSPAPLAEVPSNELMEPQAALDLSLSHQEDDPGLKAGTEGSANDNPSMDNILPPPLPNPHGQCCDATGAFLPEGSPPPPAMEQLLDDWTPYDDHTQFKFTEFVYTRNHMPASQITELFDILAASLLQYGRRPFFASSEQLYRTIDKTPLGDIKWEQLSVHYTGEHPPDNIPPWMDQTWEEMAHGPYREFEMATDTQHWHDFMSADWAWKQVDAIAEDPETHGSAFVPIILGSDKTTVLVAMGQNDYYPLYMSIGNAHNNIGWAHNNALVLIGFLAMPKTMKQHSLKPGMSNPEVTRFGDSYYHRVIYGFGPYIADYEEQVLLSCIVCNWCAKCLAHQNNLDDEDALFWCCEYTEALIAAGFALDALWNEYGIVGQLVPFTNDFPHADIHELLALDLLHQIIKGSFKDHLVEWVEKYLKEKHGVTQANVILDDIVHRYVLSFLF
ncbi:hypothetical protein PAXINDRAFT_8646 [Paxillus involutus ATCC 200175]|nr:hypothetical protein PAXINDRAFT_8646 [Paxillus involutus ATCC 200175]